MILAELAWATPMPTAKTVQASDLPHREQVRQYLQRSQLPAHIKDVLQERIFNGTYYDAALDFTFPGKDQPVDWHIDDKTRRVYAHVSFATGAITFYPGFLSLSQVEQVELVVHMGLHQMQGLGLSRMSEPVIRTLSDLIKKDQSLTDAESKRKMRTEMRAFLDQRWALTTEGSVYLAPPANAVLLPWPFDKKKAEAKNGK